MKHIPIYEKSYSVTKSQPKFNAFGISSYIMKAVCCCWCFVTFFTLSPNFSGIFLDLFRICRGFFQISPHFSWISLDFPKFLSNFSPFSKKIPKKILDFPKFSLKLFLNIDRPEGSHWSMQISSSFYHLYYFSLRYETHLLF